MGEIGELVVSWALTTAALFALLTWDERRMPEAQLARAWPDATKRLAVVVGGVLCLPIHFGRTRRSVLGVLLGVAWMVGIAFAIDAIVSAIEWCLGA